MRIVSVVGTRPQLIKAAALSPVLRARHEEVFVDTGQHWDDELAGNFFAELELPQPDHSLGVGGGSNASQIARTLEALEPVLRDAAPDAVLVYGDTNSTLGGALAAAQLGLPIAHVEAGLRSFDRRMPEEINRVVADHLSTWLLAPTPTAVRNLEAEGRFGGTVLVGDLMQDLAARTLPRVRDAAVLRDIGKRLGLDLQPGGYAFATIHRAENRDAAAVRAWAELLERAAAAVAGPVLLALHPGTGAVVDDLGLQLPEAVVAVPPLGYATSLALQLHAAAVLTDSGGVQREAGWLGVPCLVLRSTTEWHEAVADSLGGMVVVGLDAARAVTELRRLAPHGRAEPLARRRAAEANLEAAGAAAAIVGALEAP